MSSTRRKKLTKGAMPRAMLRAHAWNCRKILLRCNWLLATQVLRSVFGDEISRASLCELEPEDPERGLGMQALLAQRMTRPASRRFLAAVMLDCLRGYTFTAKTPLLVSARFLALSAQGCRVGFYEEHRRRVDSNAS